MTTEHTLVPGIRGYAEAMADSNNTAIALESGDLPVFGSIAMIGLMEKSAYRSVMPYLPADWHTVGIHLDVRHLAATIPGALIAAESELLEIDGRRLVFRVTASDPAGLIGEGTHERFMVERESFLQRAAQRNPRP